MTHMRRNITQDMRLKAACKPHTSLDRVRVVKNIQMAGSALNSDMLVNLALHEPRTFKVIKRDCGLILMNYFVKTDETNEAIFIRLHHP